MLNAVEKTLTVIVKPTSECNFRCKYCYHADTDYVSGVMSEQYLEKLIEAVQNEFDRVMYIWHGGEPLLCGLKFFKRAVFLQKKHSKPNQIILNSVQTNGSLLDDEYIEFFIANDFSVSVSFDGPGECNSLRCQTEETNNIIKAAIKKGLKTASISVVHAGNCHKQIEMYEHFKALGVPMKFNPIFNSGGARSIPEYALNKEEYIASLKQFFDYWLVDQAAVVNDTLEQYLGMVLYGQGRDCIYRSCLYHWIGVDYLGDIYPCGRSYAEEYKLGNLGEIEKISDVFRSENFINLLKKSIVRRSKCQVECKYYGFCNGGCNNNAIIEGDLENNHNFLCDVLKSMYEYIQEKISVLQRPGADLEKVNPIIRKRLNEKCRYMIEKRDVTENFCE